MVTTFKDYLGELASMLGFKTLDYRNRAELSDRLETLLFRPLPEMDYLKSKGYSNVLRDRPNGDVGKLIKSLYDLSGEEALDYHTCLCYAGLKENARPKIYLLEAMGVAMLEGNDLFSDAERILLCWPEVTTFKPDYDEQKRTRCIARFNVNEKSISRQDRKMQVLGILRVDSLDKASVADIEALSVQHFRDLGYNINAKQLGELRGRIIGAKEQ